MDLEWDQIGKKDSPRCLGNSFENDNEKNTKKEPELHPEPLNPRGRLNQPGCPSPRTPLLLRIERFLHLLARIAETIRVLSGI